MPSNLKKALGTAVVAVLAMSAMAASAAQGFDKLTAESYPATLEGSATDKTFVLDKLGQEIVCPEIHFDAVLTGPSETLFVTPTVTQSVPKPCKVGPLPATVTLNGCAFLFHVGNTTAFETAEFTTDLKCPAGKDIEIDAYASEAAHTENKPICHTTITEAPNNGLKGTHLTVDTAVAPAKHDLTISGAISPITVTQVRTSAVSCPPGTHDSSAKFTFKTPLTLIATNAVGAKISVDLGF